MDSLRNVVRKIKIYGNDYWEFYHAQNSKVKERINWTINLILTTSIIPEKYFKHIEGQEGLYEIRISAGSNIFRIFCFFDAGNLIIVLNGFQKKTQKTPKKEIERAVKLKKDYYEQKQ